MTGPATRIQVVDDDAVFLESLVAILESWGFDVDAFGDAESFERAAADPPADCILLDVKLGAADGLTLLEALRASGAETPVIMITGHGDVSMAVRAMRSGAQDFIEKPFDDEDLVHRIEAVIRNRQARGPGAEALGRLTPREKDVLREVVAGYSNKIIAHHLGLSPKTVEVHRSRVMDKTGAKNLPQLVRMAIAAGLDPDGGEE